MTFDANEISLQDGAPIELYEFRRDTLRWRYTSGADDVTLDAVTWAAELINRSAIETTSSADKASIKINVARDNAVADLFRITPPSDIITVYVYRYHASDVDEETRVLWIGRVLNCEWRGSEAVLTCEPFTTSMNRVGLRRLYQRNCPHTLYGSMCGVTRATYEVAGTIDSISTNTVSISEADVLADGYFNGGGIEWVNDDNVTERRLITDHTGAVLTLTLAIADMPVGASVTIFPGCTKTTSICLSKFNNLNNYGGFPFIGSNPFDKSLSY
jgi:uncharacterized phage protein (TIGR02218 family)